MKKNKHKRHLPTSEKTPNPKTNKIKKTSLLGRKKIVLWKINGTLLYDKNNLVLTNEEIETLKSVAFQIANIPFKNESKQLVQGSYKTYKLLNDAKFRKSVLKNPYCVYKNGTPNKPNRHQSYNKYSWLNVYHVPEKVVLIDSNEKLYDIMVELFQKRKLHIIPDRITFCVPNAPGRKAQLNINLFNQHWKKDLKKIYSIVHISSPRRVPLHESGAIQVVRMFKHFIDLAREFCHPLTGLEGHRYPIKYLKVDKTPLTSELFDLKAFNEYINNYRLQQQNVRPPNKTHWLHFKQFENKHIKIPKRKIVLKWETVRMEPGQVFSWYMSTPHRTTPNYGGVVTINYHYTSFPKPTGYHKTALFKSIKRTCLELAPIHKGAVTLEHDEFDNKNYTKKFTENGKYNFPKQSELYKKLIGFDRMTGKNIYWKKKVK